jgi:dTDP-4-amino-4,6-dideoxygalactose transaminase
MTATELAQIPVFRPGLAEEEIAAAVEALRMGWLGMGSYVGRFEDALHEAIGGRDRHVVAVSTGHAGLHLALRLAGVGAGDEVITPSFNNVADFQAILAVGAEPVFADIDAETLCVDPDCVAALISPRTKAIVVTDYACRIADHDAIAAIAADNGLRVIHDAAHSFGSRRMTPDGPQPVGAGSDLCVFSFDPVKIVTCIDGGALIVRSEAEAARAREMRLLGMGQPVDEMYRNRRAWTHDVREMGFRYHLANVHAAIGLAQLAKLPEFAERRRRAWRRYDDGLECVAEVRRPRTDLDDIIPFMYPIRVPAGRRESFRASLAERGIDTGLHWQPGHWFELFRSCRRDRLEATDRVGRELVTIPFHAEIDAADQARVIDAIRGFFST